MPRHQQRTSTYSDQVPWPISSLKSKLDEISFENGRLRKKTGSALEGEEDAPRKPSFLQSEVGTLRQKVEAAQSRIHDLEQELLEVRPCPIDTNRKLQRRRCSPSPAFRQANADQEELGFLRKLRALGKSSMLA